MSLRHDIANYAGEWSGVNRLWLMPEDPVRESETKASVSLAAGDGFAVIRYSWSDGGTPHDGVLMVKIGSKPSSVDMIWIDSFHTAGEFMQFHPEEDRDGYLSARGSYSAPPGPDWGWRIALRTDGNDSFHIVMDNITPDGEEAVAVEAKFTRNANG